jgi:hypothetical protein
MTEPENPPVTVSRRITGFHPPDLRIAISLGLGLTYDEVAAITPCGRSNIAYRLEANKAFIDEWRDFTAKALEKFHSREEEVGKANYLKRKEGLLQTAEKIFKKALDDGLDPKKSKDFQRFLLAFKAAESLENRLYGTPKQKIETEATDTKVLEIGPAFMALIEKTEERARQRLLQSGDEIVVEVIPSDTED